MISHNQLNIVPLIEAARSGNQEAFNKIINYYEPEIRKIASKYFLARADYEDLLQEGRIAIYNAILSYNISSEIPFLHFVRMVIKRKLIDTLRAHNRQKHSKLNEALSLNNAISDDQNESFIDFLPNNNKDPEITLIEKDEARIFVEELTTNFSQLELNVFNYLFVIGMKHKEVIQRLGLTSKSLDNAIQRIKRKANVYRSHRAG